MALDDTRISCGIAKNEVDIGRPASKQTRSGADEPSLPVAVVSRSTILG